MAARSVPVGARSARTAGVMSAMAPDASRIRPTSPVVTPSRSARRRARLGGQLPFDRQHEVHDLLGPLQDPVEARIDDRLVATAMLGRPHSVLEAPAGLLVPA